METQESQVGLETNDNNNKKGQVQEGLSILRHRCPQFWLLAHELTLQALAGSAGAVEQPAHFTHSSQRSLVQ